jgi:hypothetical protein
MILLSCVNCCHNPLQSDALGTSVGYCTQHRRLLLTPSHLTCGRHFRKDLPAAQAAQERDAHAKRFTPSAIVQLTKKKELANGGSTSVSSADFDDLSADPVAVAAREYGKLESKIGSIAQLRFLPGIRPELAMMSLGRVYVNRCVQNKGPWTSGLHLIWWTRRRLREVPDVKVEDLRVETPVPLSRQVELARWSIMMMRLILISDVASYASKQERIARLASLAEHAAADTGELSPGRLERWIKRKGEDLFDAALPQGKYEEIAATLHKEPDDTSP